MQGWQAEDDMATPYGRAMVPRLEAVWTATTFAAADLDSTMPNPLSQLLDIAIEALVREPFAERIHRSRSRHHAGRATAEAQPNQSLSR